MRYEEGSSRHGEFQRRGASASLSDLVNQYARFNATLMDGLSQTLTNVMELPKTMERNPKRKHFRDECSDPCYEDPCHCRCCIYDADLVVYARLGELRVVPIRLENPRRREREVSLVLSDWHTSGGKKANIQARILPEMNFTLPPCSEKELVLLIDAGQAEMSLVHKDKRQSRLMDVDDCLVLYANLSVEGCGTRPVRIALALLPRDCSPFVIECLSSCC
jgi:hypothetical protein